MSGSVKGPKKTLKEADLLHCASCDFLREKSHFSPSPNHISLKSYKKTAFWFLGLAGLLLIAIAYVSFARATVIITPRMTDAEVEISVEVRKDPAEGEAAGDVRAVILSGEKFEAISGEEFEAPATATGTVRIINQLSRSQPLVATTRFLAPDGVLFRLKKGAVAPAKGFVLAEIYADKPGKEGNKEPTKFTIPGLSKDLQSKIYGETFEPTIGGVVHKVGVSQADVDRAAKEIASGLLEQGVAEIKKNWTEWPGTDELYQIKILEVSAEPPVGSDAGNVKVRARVQIAGVRFDRETLYDLAEESLKQKGSLDSQLRAVFRENFKVEINKLEPELGVGTVKAMLAGKFSITEKSSILDSEQLVGLTRSSAENYLKGFHSVDDAKIKISPFWLRRLPNLRDRINIKVITK